MDRTIGHGPCRAVALHCALAHGGAWSGIGDGLSDLVTLHAPDLPGHGSAPSWEGDDYTADAMQQVLPLLNQPVHLVGHSFGAVLALSLSLAHPGLVKSLVLIEPVLFAACPTHAVELAAQREWLSSLMEAGDREALASEFFGLWGGATAWEDLPEAVRARIWDQIHMIPAQFPTLYDDAAGLLAAGKLEKLDLPALLIDGGASAPVIPCILDTLQLRLPDTRRIRVPQAGHMVPITHPGQVAVAMRDFYSDMD